MNRIIGGFDFLWVYFKKNPQRHNLLKETYIWRKQEGIEKAYVSALNLISFIVWSFPPAIDQSANIGNWFLPIK